MLCPRGPSIENSVKAEILTEAPQPLPPPPGKLETTPKCGGITPTNYKNFGMFPSCIK